MIANYSKLHYQAYQTLSAVPHCVSEVVNINRRTNGVITSIVTDLM